MICLGGPGGGWIKPTRAAASQARRRERAVPPRFSGDQPISAGTAVMITTAWASGGSSVRVRSSRGRHPGGRDLVEAPQRAAGQPHRRPARGQVDDPEIAPEHAAAKPGAERLGARLLGGEAAGIARRPVGPPVAFAALGLGEDAVEKAVAEPVDGLLDAADVDQVAAEAEDHRAASATISSSRAGGSGPWPARELALARTGDGRRAAI